jgi:peptide/nickel transport system permease protein
MYVDFGVGTVMGISPRADSLAVYRQPLLNVYWTSSRAVRTQEPRQEYVTVARAKGLAERLVVRKHALRNALVPVVTIIGLQTGRLFGGAVVVETIFSIPGVGRLAVDSIYFRDFPMVQGVVLVLALAVVLANLVTDILYGYIDPRIRYA